MPKLKLKEIRKFILDSIEIIVIFPLTIYTVYIAVTGQTVPDNRISALTVAILAFLALSLLKDRFNRKKLEKSLTEIPIRQNLSMRFREIDYKEIVRNLVIESKKSIWMITRTGVIIDEIKFELEEALKKGHEIKIVVCDSKNDDLKKIIIRVCEQDEDTIESFFKRGEKGYEYLHDKYPDLIEKKIIGFTPPQLMYITDTNENNGDSNSTAFIIPFSFKSRVRSAPSLKFKFNEDPKLFEYYFKLINRLWEYQEDDCS